MYALDGISLTNPQHGWELRPGSVPYATITANVDQVTRRGRDGSVVLPGSADTNLMKFVINTPPSGIEPLNRLCRRATLLTDSRRAGVSAPVVFATSAVSRIFPRSQWVDMDYYFILRDAAWRDTATTTSAPVALNASQVDVDVFSGISAPIPDVIVRVRGACAGLRVTDSNGSWFLYTPSIAANTYLRFHPATQEAFLTSTDTWTGGTDVSGILDFGGPRDAFEVTPHFTTDPGVATGRLTVTTTSRSSAAVQVRGRSAYLF